MTGQKLTMAAGELHFYSERLRGGHAGKGRRTLDVLLHHQGDGPATITVNGSAAG